MDRNQQQQQGSGGSQPLGEKIDARFNEEPHVIYDRLKAQTAGSAGNDFLVLGTKADGSPFMWSTGDDAKTRELAKVAAPVLSGIEA